MSQATSSTLSMIPLATHQVAASTLSATVPTTHFAISQALSIAPHARSPTHQSRSPARPPAHFTASPIPQATPPAASATHQATQPTTSVAPFATEPAALATPHAIDPAAPSAHQSILSRENAPPHKRKVSNEPIRMKRSFGSNAHPTVFHAKSMIIAHTSHASLVLYQRTSPAPAKI